MRFLLLTQYFPPEIGAPQVRLASVARELVRLGHTVEVITALPNYPTGRIFPGFRKAFYRRERWENVLIHRLWLYASMGTGLKRLLNYASFTLTSLFGLMKVGKPDYIFVESPPLFLSVPGFIASRLWRVPFIFNVADLWPDSVLALGIMQEGLFIRAALALERWTYRKAKYVNAMTEGMRTTLLRRKNVPPEKLLFLPNGVDTKVFRPIPPDLVFKQALGLDGKKVVLYAGTHGHTAAVEQALHAAKLLSDKRDIHFLFVGGGSEKAWLVKLAQDLGLTNASFLDAVPAEDLSRLLSIAFCTLVTAKDSPIFEDARPAKMYAMMAAAKPVVLAIRGEAARLMEEARAGIAVPPETPEALAQAVVTLDNDPALAAELGRNGRKYVEQNFRWSVLIEKWLGQFN